MSDPKRIKLDDVGTTSAHSLPVANQSLTDAPVNMPHHEGNFRTKLRAQEVIKESTNFEKELLSMTQAEKTEKEQTVWERPSIEQNGESITFQQLDAEETMIEGKSAVRFYGVTKSGHSVLCNVIGFRHYFLVPLPKGLGNYENFCKFLSSRFGEPVYGEVCLKESIWGYNNNVKVPFLKLSVDNAKHIAKLRGAFERGEIQYEGHFTDAMITFDSVQYVLRMMVDCQITGMSWLSVNRYREVDRVSTCQYEVVCDYKDLVSHAPEGEFLEMAPLRVLSFDIECAGRKGIFPEAEHDPVIQIANVVSRTGESTPFIRNVFTVKSCAPIVGSEIYSFEKEAEMLLAWRDFVVKADPDVIIGYNIANFDLPYLLNRAEALKLKSFPYFSRMRSLKQEVKDSIFSSRAYGTRENKVVNIEGRVQLDLLQFIQREYKLRSYTLNSVSAHFLNEQKEDVPHSIITDLQEGDSESRRRLAVYCLKDAYLPLRLAEKLMCLVNYTEMARVTGVPFSYLLARGQQIKVISQLFRKCRDLDIVIPNMKPEGGQEEYEGATVIEPKRGYYDTPVATLDFASLYPSIMMAHNLCYTTLISRQTIERLKIDKNDYTHTPNGDFFVKSNLRSGILPTILQELLSARKRARNDLKNEKDPFKRQVLNGRQLALKISANSVYGFTGATIGKLPCLAISSSVTAFGRQMIEKTKTEVESKYCIENGFPYNADVIYGDTDSVMVKFGPTEQAECMRLGQEAADYVSTKFQHPIKLEFEKVYFPYLLINKKRYAGVLWTNPDKPDKMDTKGIETVRRDNCRLVQNVITKVLELVLESRNVSLAESFVKSTIADLLQDKVDMSQLVITKALSKYDYAGKQAHVELAERMRKRDAGSAPTLGDRVAYVIIKTSGDKNYEKSEDPLYVLEHSLPIDTKYYLENQLSKPLTRIFEPILGERRAKELLTGSHTRTVIQAAPKTGGLMRFAKKSNVCKNCKNPIDSSAALCENCVSKAGNLYVDALEKMNQVQIRFNKLWTECQRCQGSLHQEVLCSNNDCPIFYMRMKAQKELKNQSDEMLKWDETDW